MEYLVAGDAEDVDLDFVRVYRQEAIADVGFIDAIEPSLGWRAHG